MKTLAITIFKQTSIDQCGAIGEIINNRKHRDIGVAALLKKTLPITKAKQTIASE